MGYLLAPINFINGIQVRLLKDGLVSVGSVDVLTRYCLFMDNNAIFLESYIKMSKYWSNDRVTLLRSLGLMFVS